MSTPLRKYLYWSAGCHLLVFLIFVWSPYIPFGSSHFRQEKVVWIQLPKGPSNTLGSSVKKSQGLPKSTIEEQKRVIPSPPKAPEMTYQQKPEDKPPQQKPPKPPPGRSPPGPRQKNPISDVLSRLQRQVNDREKAAPPEAAQIPETQPGGFTFGSPTAQYVPINDPEYVIYQAKIRQQIMDEWIIPLKYTDPSYGLICKIIVHINDQGEVKETEWEQRSGNEAYDASALRAIEKASPLVSPPERLKWEVLNEGFIVDFNPQNAKAAM